MDVSTLGWVLVVLAAVALGFATHRLLLRLERRGWIYYRTRGSGSMGAAALFGLSEVFHPEGRHAAIEQQHQDVRGARRVSPDEPPEASDPSSPG